jgi:hypothetical protein
VSDYRKRFKPGETATPVERRRRGTVVHDERGNASVEWRDAPADQKRPVLEVLGEDGLTLKSDEASYDPYARTRPGKGGGGRRTDPRKLSEWIKQMRDLEERKRNGGNGDGE